MAEAFLNHIAGNKFEAHSAGLEPREISPYTKQVMQEAGIDITNQYPKSLKDFMGKTHFGYLITVCAQAEEKCPSTFPDVSKRLFWDFENPDAFDGSEEDKLDKFRDIRDQIKEQITQWLAAQP